MLADALVMARSKREQVSSIEQRERAEVALERVRQATEQIRHMTELYRERLEGSRVRQP